MKKIVVAFLSFLLLGLWNVPTSIAANPNVEPRAYEEIARCLNSKNVLNVFFLVDSSGSLQNTDPLDKRAKVLSSALSQFSNAREGAKVNFSLGTFGEVFTTQYPWTRVNGSSLNTAKDWIEREVPRLDNENYTDWLAGLRNATKALANAPQSEESCKIILWLTDGGINVPTNSGFDSASAIELLCGVSPFNPDLAPASGASALMDSIRRSGITVIGVLLKSEADLERLKRDDPEEYKQQISTMSYMRAIVESIGAVDGYAFSEGLSNFQCGQSPIPAASSAGVLVEVNDANDLGLNFARIWLNASGGQPGSVIGTSPFKFTIEPGVSRVVVLIQAKTWTLNDSNGQEVANQSGASDPRVSILQTGNVYQVSVDSSSQSSLGEWNGTGPSLVELFLYSNLGIDLKTDIQFGMPAQITGQVYDAAGNPIGLGDYGSADISVMVVTDGVNNQPVQLQLDPATGQFSGEFAPPAGVTRAIFDVTLNLTTKSGQKLKPIEQRIEQAVALGAEYPDLSPTRVQFSELAGPSGTANGKISIKGSSLGNSQVCFLEANVVNDPKPERILSYVWNSNGTDGCITVETGETNQLEISVSNPEGAEGLVDGTLNISVKPEGGSERVLQVPFEMQTTWPPNEFVRTLVLIGLTLLSILLPWLFLHMVNVRNSRLVAGSLMKRIEVPVLVSGMGVRGPVTPENKYPSTLEIHAKDYQFMSISDRPSEYLDSSTGVKIAGKAPLNPFGNPKLVVTAPSGSQLIAKPLMDTDLGGAWIVVASNTDLMSANGAELSARLVSFIRTTGDDVELAQNRNVEIAASAVWQNLSTYVDAAIAEQSSSIVDAKEKRQWSFGRKKEVAEITSPPSVAPDPIWGAGSPNPTVGDSHQGSSDSWGTGSKSSPATDKNDDTGFDWSR